MTVRDNVHTVPRLIVSGYLKAVRLPLTATERITNQQDNDQWPPSLAFERFEAGVETVAGSLLRDPELVGQGRLRQAKVAQLRKAAELDTRAVHEKKRADQRLRQRRKDVADKREETDQRAEQRKHELERQADIHERKVEEKAAKKTAAARQDKAAQDKAITREERAGKAASLAAESHALSTTKEALEADETVDVIDASIEGTEAARKTS
jgi:hypothetical protein